VSYLTVDDALRMHATLARWLSTGDGSRCAFAIGELIHSHFPRGGTARLEPCET
jgi:hypothetical protein